LLLLTDIIFSENIGSTFKCEASVTVKGQKVITVKWLHRIVTNITAGANCGVGDTVVKYRGVNNECTGRDGKWIKVG